MNKQTDPFAHIPHVRRSPSRVVEMRLATKTTTTDWYAPYGEHQQQFETLLVDFQESLEETLMTILDETTFDYREGSAQIGGFDETGTFLYSWSPDWFIVLPLTDTVLKRLRREHVAEELTKTFHKAAHQLVERPEINFKFHWAAEILTVELLFAYEDI